MLSTKKTAELLKVSKQQVRLILSITAQVIKQVLRSHNHL